MKFEIKRITAAFLSIAMLLSMNAFIISPALAATTAEIEVASPAGTSTSPYSVNLTAGGYDDWAHFGHTTATSVNRKAEVDDRLIGSLSLVGAGSLQDASTDDVTNHRMQFTWTDGTPPNASLTTKYFVKNGAEGIKLNFPLTAGSFEIKMFTNCYNERADVVLTNASGVEIARKALITGSIETWAHMAREITITYDSDIAQTVTVSIARTEFDAAQWPGLSVAAAAVKKIMSAPDIYSVSASASPSSGGNVTGAGLYTKGNTVNMTASANAGYVFKEWQVISGGITLTNKTANNISFTMPESNVDLRAVFSRPEGELEDLTQYISMRLGTSGASNTLIGTQRPNASVSPGPDTNPQNSCTGYNPNGQIRGFSQIHVSGTGVGKYGQFLVSPQVGLATRLDGHDSDKTNETPTCSEYSVTLSRYGINAAFTPAEHSTIYKFVYPQAGNASVLIDVAANIANANATNIRVNTGVNDKGEPYISGSGNYSGGWGSAHNLYFYAVLQKTNATLGLYNASGTISGTSMGPVNVSDRTAGMGAYATFSTTANEVVYLKIATSFKSIDQAKIWLDQEIPTWDYYGVRDETDRLWNEELNKIVIDGDISSTNLQIFYTAIYHAHIMPRDRTGDIEKFGSADIIDDHLCVWDTWRTLFPLYAITNPDIVSKNINSFITRNNINKYVRDSFVAGVDMAEQQGGDDIDCVVSDAYVKGIGGVDWEEAYKVVKNNADNYRLSWLGWGTQNLNPNVNTDYKNSGYIPSGGTRQMNNCSYTLEYAYNDYCAALIAKGLGKTADYEKYLARSNNWTNIWNPNLTNNGYSGYIVPREADFGSFIDINPTTSWGSWVDYFYEASAWNYSFFVPHDVKQLIEKMGGQETFANRLKTGVDRGWVDFGNEPAFLAVALYNHTDRPWMTSDSMASVRSKFSLTGVPGNDDSGAMSSWYIFSATGLFPNAGQNIYYITSPIYESTTYNLDNGKQFSIIANNLSATNKYIQSVTINGKPYYKTWFGHEVIVAGSTIVYEMGSNPVNYAKAPANSVKIKEISSVQSVNINLSDPKYSEWAHFTDTNTINRKIGVAEPVVGSSPSGYTILSQYLNFSWIDGTPTQTAQSVNSYISNPGNIRLPLKIPVGSFDVTIYVIGAIGFSVFNEADDELLKHYENSYGTSVTMATLSFDCEQAEEFTLVLADISPAMNGANIAAVTVEPFKSFTVSFDSSGADERPNQIVRAGGKVTEPEALTRPGYVFGGWISVNPVLDRYWIFNQDVVTGDLTLKAVWIPLHTVTFVPNGGSFVATQTLPQGSRLEPAPITRTGYTFDGWYRNAEFSGAAWNFDIDIVQANTTLYAKWTKLPEAKIVFADYLTEATDIDLSGYDDWATFGLGNAVGNWIVRKNIGNSIIGGISGDIPTSENLNESLYSFSWNGGTPLASAQKSKYAVVGLEPMIMTFNVPAGGYTAEVYYTVMQGTTALVEIIDERGMLLDEKLLPSKNGAGVFDGIAKLAFYCDEPREFTLRLTHGITTILPVYKYAFKAVAITLEAPGVTVISGGNGMVSGGGIYEPGSTVTLTATPDTGYRFKEWQIISGNASIANTASASFAMPDKSVTLKAVFEEPTVWVRSNDTVANLSRITLSQPQYADWAYLGYSSGRIMMSNATSRIFTSNVSAVSGGLTQEDMAQWNSGSSPYFNWTGGTPTATGTDIRYILWNNIGLRLNVTIPKGLYEVGLYISGVRAGAELEVLDPDNNVVLTYHLWNNNGETRVYRKLNIDFACKQQQTYTIRLLVSDQGAANYSVSIFAGIAEKLGDYYTVEASAGQGGTATGSGEYYIGQTAVLTATADEGYIFDGWYDNGIKISDDAEYRFNVSGNRILEARFAKLRTYVEISREGESVTATYHIYNTSGEPLTHQCLLAVYDSRGRLCELKSTVPSVSKGLYNYEITLAVASSMGYQVKAFIWSYESIPLCDDVLFIL